MDNHNRQRPSESSDEEENNFAWYMDENGVIGMDEEGLLKVDSQGDLELEDDDEQVLAFDEEWMEELYKEGILRPGTPSGDDRSGVHSWQEDFSLSGVADERPQTENLGNSDGFISHDTGNHSSLRHTSKSITLPSVLDRHPPSRDQQLDMTEDEVDRGSSPGAWNRDEDDSWNQAQSELFDESPLHRSYEGYGQTSREEPKNEVEFYENPANQEDQDATETLSPSSPPIPSTWDTKLMSRFGRLSIGPRIEDETLPESSCTESAENPEVIPSQISTNISNFTRDSKQVRTVRSKTVLAPTKTQHGEPPTMKKSKLSTTPLYGRGQLNYPLPDFSKVGPKVRFPKDEEGYRPPQPRRPEMPSQGVPVIFKSPAEIVREVLLSSTEKPVQETVVSPAVPPEFKTPQEATELVHQLQEDYHKLLTKYAEAENTIDRLRLGAKVHLYSDPPQPSHSIHMGTVNQGTKLMEFSIPHPQAATFSSVDGHHGTTEVHTGSSDHQKPSVTSLDHLLPETSGSSSLHPPEDVSSTLMSHLETLYREVELFEELLHSGNLTPGEQQQAVRELRGSLDLLEQRYLKAQEQQRNSSGNLTGKLDPKRELEEAIFQLGVQLEELQEQVENSPLSSPNSQLRNNLEDKITAHHLGNAPIPSASAPIPALQTPYPQILSPEPLSTSKADVETLSKEDPAEYLPQPLLHKHKQVERDYGTLLSTYSSFKSLPDALGSELEEWPQQPPQSSKPHDHPQDAPSQGHSDESRSQKGRPLVHLTSLRTQEAIRDTRQPDPFTSVTSQDYEDHLQTVSPHDHHIQRPKQHTQLDSPRSHPITSSPHVHHPTERSSTHQHDAPSGIISGHTSLPMAHHRISSVLSGQRISPDEMKPSVVRRMSQGSKTFPPRVSLSSSMPHVRGQHSRTPTAMPSVNEESARSPQSHRSGSSKSVSPPAEKKPLRTKGSVSQRRILSPETDSGFLGSESSRSIQKQRDHLRLTQEDPEEAPDPNSNSPNISGRHSSSKAGDPLSRNRKTVWDKIKPNNRWTGPSEASSPSPGPKSLTESESAEHIDESCSEQEAYNNVIAEPSPGASQLLSPMEDLSTPDEDILQSRTAKDQAIYNLQKEVNQLRKHLESSLHCSPIRGRSGQSATNQNLHDGKAPNFASDLGTPISKRGSPAKETKEGYFGSFMPRDHDRCRSPTQGGQRVQGAYTGTQYQVSRSPPPPQTEHFTISPCQRCQENERKNSAEFKKTSKKEKNFPLMPSDCPLCRGNNESDDSPGTGTCAGQNKQRSRRRPHCNPWIMSHTPPVSYIQAPVVQYSPPIIYGTPASFYSPVAYNPPERRRSHSVTPPPSSEILQLTDLTWPLNKALEAAKELKSTSRRMCRSLTSDLSKQCNLRGSCLF
ncbi:microtubule organization protein AKNA [Dendrobates tinctorius]|uniref:microtubule organization protein AKNA n=1 Tax=Dendrobates tinctorius TaxID=92724 RepID=UPI003CC944A1